MPVVVITPSKAKADKVNQYIMRSDKTEVSLTFGYGCTPDNFADDFKLLQNSFRKGFKKEDRKYYHIKLSWHTDEELSPEEAKVMAEEFCARTNVKGCMYAGTIHTDTDTLHAHILINNCRLEDNEYGRAGESFQSTRESWREMMEVANRLAREKNLDKSIINLNGKTKERMSAGEVQMIKRETLPWKDVLKQNILEARDNAGDETEFIKILKDDFQIEVRIKNGTYVYFPESFGNKGRGCPERRLGDSFSRVEVVKELDGKEKEYEREREF